MSIRESFCEMHGKVHLWHYVNQSLLWISVTENLNCLTTFYDRFPYQISVMSIKHFVGCVERSIFVVSKQLLVKVVHIEFQEHHRMIYALCCGDM
jgi:hypothetical protein